MAGDWIKIRKDLIDDPAVLSISHQLDITREEVVGLLVRFWSWVDSHVADGNHTPVTNVTVDELIGNDGFAKALEDAGWASFDDGYLKIPNFERHLSHNAKQRALTKEKVRNWRNLNVTAKRLPEKRREEKRCNTPLVPKGDERVIDWNEHLNRWNGEVASTLHAPMIHHLNPNRKQRLKARLEEHPDLWDRVIAEAKLLGQFARDKGFIKFDWLLSPANLTKYLEGNYRTKDQINVQPKPTAEDLAAAYTPPPGAPSGWRDRKAPAARGLDLDIPPGGDGADRTGRAAP